MLSESTIRELAKIIKEDGFDEDLSYQQVEEIARNLVGYFSKLAELDFRINDGQKELKKDN